MALKADWPLSEENATPGGLSIAQINTLKAELQQSQARVAEFERTARNMLLCIGQGVPTPYGHDCIWCGHCVLRAGAELEAALAQEPA